MAFLSVFKILPWWVWAVAGLLGWAWYNGHQARIEKEKAATATLIAESAQDKAKREKEARDAQQQQIDKRAAIAEADAKQAAKDRAAALAANTRAVGLLKLIDERAAASRAQQAASAVTGSPAGDLLGAVLKSCVNEYTSLGADAADAARRGKRCEAEADAITGVK